MDEELEEEDDELGTILLAELEWKPQTDFIDWTDPNFSQEIVDRINGLNQDTFAKEVELWQHYINMLPVYNEYEIRKEVSFWNISIPGKDDFNYESYAMHYAMQVQYKNRLTEITSVVYAHYEMISQAHKTLKEMSVKIAPGSNKHEKDGIASFMVHPFSVAMANVKKLLVYLEAVSKNIDFAASQMDRMSREHQYLSKINQSFNNEGMSNLFQRNTPLQLKKIEDSTVIKTRNRRLNNFQNNS